MLFTGGLSDVSRLYSVTDRLHMPLSSQTTVLCTILTFKHRSTFQVNMYTLARLMSCTIATLQA